MLYADFFLKEKSFSGRGVQIIDFIKRQNKIRRLDGRFWVKFTSGGRRRVEFRCTGGARCPAEFAFLRGANTPLSARSHHEARDDFLLFSIIFYFYNFIVPTPYFCRAATLLPLPASASAILSPRHSHCKKFSPFSTKSCAEVVKLS